jgi:hypothetical protein
MYFVFVKIWSEGVENHQNYHKLEFEWFCFVYDCIIVAHEEIITSNS